MRIITLINGFPEGKYYFKRQLDYRDLEEIYYNDEEVQVNNNVFYSYCIDEYGQEHPLKTVMSFDEFLDNLAY